MKVSTYCFALLVVVVASIRAQSIDDFRRAKQLTNASVLSQLSRATLNISARAMSFRFGQSSLKIQKLVSDVIQFQGLPERLNQFTWKLYNYMSTNKTDNFFISPFSIFTVMAMTMVGAQNTTEAQLKNFLCLQMDQQDMLPLFANYFSLLNMVTNRDTVLSVANRIFARLGFKFYQDFVNTVDTFFQSQVQFVDFSNANDSSRVINGWVANKTNNKITNLVDPSFFTPMTSMFLINAIYFKGRWLNQFATFRTTRMNFTLSTGNLAVVDMMRNNKERLNTQVNPTGLNAISCEIPYVGSTSMTILLPHRNSSIQELEASLTPQRINAILAGSYYVRTDLFLPRFNINFKADLSGVAKDLGAPIPFDRTQANFSGIMPDLSSKQNLFISSILHQSTIQVTENGTEAAAATAVVIMLTSGFTQPEETITVQCDRPFLFIIHETLANGILFIGKLMTP